MILFIDTSDAEKISLGLIEKESFLVQKNFAAKYRHAEKLLPEIEMMFRKKKLTFKKISGVCVVRGPGSFTALRIGIAVANTLGYSLKIPVLGIKKNETIDDTLAKIVFQKIKKTKIGSIIEPEYGREPNIT